ncbi:MAG: GntR family transcriptional regulator [Shinella zoogloeoides]|uniref:GntR family transcriptional regulator n=1 Tax=Shinella zoogloeoides TaxID=352475 RepID=UPI003C72E320
MAMAAAEVIRDRILAGRFQPGAQLKQDILAAECGMSRIPIREALVQLESEGLVKILPHKGAIVVELSAKEIEELFNMRTLLEPFLLKRSAPLLKPADFKSLRKILARYTDSITNQDSESWNELNTEFHMVLYRHADSPRMMATVQTLLQECDRHTRFQLSNIKGDPERAVREHNELLRLCEERKFDEAAALMWEHIDHVRVVLVDLLEKHQAAEASGQSAA